MKNTIKTRKSLNDIILQLNNPAYILTIIIYMSALILTLLLITPSRDFIVVPNYEHEKYAEEIVPQITVVGIRSFDDNEIMSLRYSVTAKFTGRLNQDKADPKLEIGRSQVSALLTNNKMYYFTEQKDRNTPISHSYTMSSTETSQTIPSKFFIKLNYKDANGQEKVGTFLEELMLDLNKNEGYSNINSISHYDETQAKTIDDVSINFIATNDKNAYTTSVWITVDDLSKRYHVDMQSWIVTESGEALPFMGVYGYSDQKNTFLLSNREANHLLKPKDLYCKLVYTVVNEKGVAVESKEILYKEAFSKLPEEYGDRKAPSEPTTPAEKPINWMLITGVGLGVVILGLGTAYVVIKKRKEKQAK
jgi:hypothetical protein